MFYRRKYHLPYANRRASLRVALPDADSLVVEIELPTEDGSPGTVLYGELVDMNIAGAGVRVPIEEAPRLEPGDLAQITIAHPIDGWSVITPCALSRVAATENGRFHLGLEFINFGNLYAQLDNAMSRYFNRRKAVRVKPELDEALTLELAWGAHRVHGKVHDLSEEGLGSHVAMVEAAMLEVGDKVHLGLALPEVAEFVEGIGEVRSKRTLHEYCVLGFRFDLEGEGSFTPFQSEITRFVDKRWAATQLWSAQFSS